jgi:hypothetical protein
MNTKYMIKTNLWGSFSRWNDNIKMDLQKVGWEGMEWIDPAQDRNRWRALVNAVKKTFEFRKMLGISWLVGNQLASREGIRYLE